MSIPVDASTKHCHSQFREVQGLLERADALLGPGKHSPEQQVSAAEFILEGLYSSKKISRSEDRVFKAAERMQAEPTADSGMQTRKRWN